MTGVAVAEEASVVAGLEVGVMVLEGVAMVEEATVEQREGMWDW